MTIPRNRATIITLMCTVLAFVAPTLSQGENAIVVMQTTHGEISIEVFEVEAPITAANFLKLVDEGYYDGLIFHRVIPGFVIQGGGFYPGMKEKTQPPTIKNEAHLGLKNSRGTLSMARLSDPDTATSQFFINLRDNTSLDAGEGEGREGYAVFAKVVDGMDVVDTIANVETGRSLGYSDVPRESVVIDSVSRTGS